MMRQIERLHGMTSRRQEQHEADVWRDETATTWFVGQKECVMHAESTRKARSRCELESPEA